MNTTDKQEDNKIPLAFRKLLKLNEFSSNNNTPKKL